jgi:hypothetical protein|tara:strand:+ start:1169 stop:1576 length:408 start_codon:yes stop_codon:yes gene_type:complete
MVEQIISEEGKSIVLEPLDGVSGWTRFGSWLLERVLMIVTLGIGWIIWAITLRGTGQTPAKKMMNLTIWDLETNAPMTLERMIIMRGLAGGLVAGFALPLTLYVLAFMPFWDKNNRDLHDKVSRSSVIATPGQVL